MNQVGTAGPLSGLRVLDLTRVLAGPWCTQTLGDLGADVVKIERPDVGDDTRHWGPPFLRDGEGTPTGQAAYYACCNRNKRSVTVNLASEQGQALVRRMALDADLLVENFKVGGLAAYQLDYPSLREANSKLIYCSVTGFGQTGPYARRAGYDLMVQAMSGLMSVTGTPEGGPLRVGVAVTDLFAGMYATTAILAALHDRQRTGVGQHVDISLMDVGMAILANQGVGFLNSGVVPTRHGNSHPSLAPYQDFPTADGAMLLAIGNDGQFARFCRVVSREEWVSDRRFATNTQRVRNRDELVAAIGEVTRQRTTVQWIDVLERHSVPCGSINTIVEAFDDPHVKARGLVVDTARDANDGIASIATVASRVRLGLHPRLPATAPPALGQHTDAVLAELGLAGSEVSSLRKAGAI